MEYSDLKGLHVLTHAAYMEKNDRGEETITIGLDGKTFIFEEDKDDGYRSFCSGVRVEENYTMMGAPINRNVVIHSFCDDFVGIKIYDVETGHLWARIGSENMNDYYPWCCFYWNPMPC